MPPAWPQFEPNIPPPYAHTTVTSTSSEHPLVGEMVAAFEDAMAMRGRLREEAFQVQGFSGRKFRLFMNGLMAALADPRYLEIGLFHGASFCSAIAHNRVRAVGIDNWTEYGGSPDSFYRNLEAFRPNSSEISILQSDFRKVDYASLGPFNVLFYDGSHAEQDQYDGVLLPQPAMDDRAILIVDDWNWHYVRSGTLNALRDARVRIDYQIEVRTNFGHEHLPLVHGPDSEWHNGCIIAAVSKT